MKASIKMAGRSLAGALLFAAALGVSAAAAEETQEPKDKTVNLLMEMAFREMPERFTDRDGTIIVIDKKSPSSVLVPSDVGREVIVAARRSARAQICDLPKEHVANFESLKARENEKKTFSIQQKKYMMMLHSIVVRVMTGRLKTAEFDAGKKVTEKEVDSKTVKPCTDAEREAVKAEVLAYVKAGPHLEGEAPQPPQQPEAAAAKK